MTMFQNLRRMLPGGGTLKVRCVNEGCGHEANLTRDEAFRLFGGDATPRDIRLRLVCGVCGRERPHVWI